MRPFTTGELTRIAAEHDSTFGDDTAVGFVATVARTPANATSTSQRETVIQSLNCRRILPMDGRQKELAGFASTERVHQCKCEINSSMTAGLWLILEDGTEYRIRDVVPVPENAPRLYRLYLAEGG